MLETAYDFLLMFLLPSGIAGYLGSLTGTSVDVLLALAAGAELAVCVLAWCKLPRPGHRAFVAVSLWFFNVIVNVIFCMSLFGDLSV